MFNDKPLLILAIFFVALPLIASQFLFVLVSELVISFIVLFFIYQYATGTRDISPAFIKARPVFALWFVWLSFIILQLIPMPVVLLEWLSPQSFWLQSLVYSEQGGLLPAWLPLTVDTPATTRTLIRSLFYLQIFVLVLLLVQRRRHLKLMAYALVLSGFFQALYGMYIVLPDHQGSGVMFASFPNRNHLANYLMMCTAAGLGMLIAQLKGNLLELDGRELLNAFCGWMLGLKMPVRFAILIMASAIIMTRSRMGNTAFLTSLLITGLLLWFFSAKRSWLGAILLIGSLLVVDVVIMGSVVGLDKVINRIENTSAEHEGRDEVAADTLVYWQDFPWLGSGLGSYYVTYPRYKSDDVKGYYNHAHNDYLQFAAEVGLVGMFILVAMGLMAFIVALKALRIQDDPWRRGTAFAVVMTTIAFVIHAPVEFNLQMFRNTTLFILMMGLGWVAFYMPSKRAAAYENLVPTQRSVLHTGLASVAVVAILVFTLQWGLSDLISLQSKNWIKGWNKGQAVEMADWQRVYEQQRYAVNLASRNSNALLTMARLRYWEIPASPTILPQKKAVIFNDMLAYLQTATRYNPGHARTWIAIADTRRLQNNYDETLNQALLRASILSPWEPHIQQGIVRIGLSGWDKIADPATKIVIKETIKRGLKTARGPMKKLLKKYGATEYLPPKANT